MDAPPIAPDLDRPAPGEELPDDHLDDSTDRIVLGVAGYVADGLGVDALWVRMAFVVLALAGGIGVMAYLALWLVVFGADRTGVPFVRYVGGAFLVVVIPLVIAGSDPGFVSGPLTVVLLLVGLTLALWQPRRPPSPRTSRALPPPRRSRALPPPRHTVLRDAVDGPAAPESDASSFGSEPTRPVRRAARPRRPRREPSILGRLAFGLAMIVAALGALIDVLNGGRLHPEQWLGAAAAVCGIGLLIGAVRGRAWWLIVPALLFAATGYLTGVMARIGMDASDAFGETSLYIGEATPGGSRTLSQPIGDLWISVDGIPQSPITIDARTAIGSLEINVSDTVSVEVRSNSDRGDLIVNGVVVPGGRGHLGPDGPADVVIDARLGLGDVRASSYRYDPAGQEGVPQGLLGGGGPFDERVLAHADGAVVDDGVGVTTDGWIVLAYGEALISPDDSIVVGRLVAQDESVSVVSTGMGEFVIGGGTLQTPSGVVYFLDDLRQQFSPDLGAVDPSPIAPDATVTPSAIDISPPITPRSPSTPPTIPTTPGG